MVIDRTHCVYSESAKKVFVVNVNFSMLMNVFPLLFYFSYIFLSIVPFVCLTLEMRVIRDS